MIGVASIHGRRRTQVNHFDEQCRRWDGETRILHVLRISGAVAAQGTQEEKNVLTEQFLQLRG